MKMRINYYEELDSTNEEAKTRAEKGAAEGTVIIADYQTAGKGRMGRTWIAQKGMNLSMSIILRPETVPGDTAQLTLLIGMVICNTLKKNYSVEANIKWPNDIILNGKKIGGILLESKIESNKVKFVVLGIGMNVNNEIFSDELKQKASSLRLETDRKFDISELVAIFLDEFQILYNNFLQKGFQAFVEEYNALCINVSRQIKFTQNNEEFTGTCLRVSETGDLVVEQETGEIMYVNSGEVSIRGMEGYI